MTEQQPPPIPLEIVGAERLDAAAAHCATTGQAVAQGFDLESSDPGDAPGVVHVGVLRNDDDIAAALLAAATGHGVIVALDVGDPWAEEEFVRQFVRLGGQHQTHRDAEALTDPDTIALLERLGAGDSIEVAARTCLMSVRTANRRLDSARQHFGVSSTLHAVLAQQRAQQ